MSVQSHLAELERRREALKKRIAECEASPSVDQIEVAALKRQKLHLKDEVERIRGQLVEQSAVH